MHLDNESVGAGGNGREREWGDERGMAARVARIDDHRKMRFSLEHRYRRHVQRVAGGRLERSDAALAEDDVRIPPRHHVLRGEEELRQRCRLSSLEQHRHTCASDLCQEGEVLHVARADLEDVSMRRYELDVPRIENLCDYRQPGRRTCFGEQRQGFGAESLKAVRGGAWLERAAAQHHRAGSFDRPCGVQQHLASFHRAGARDDGELDATDSDTLGDVDDGVHR
jgi:hypothetical protein